MNFFAAIGITGLLLSGAILITGIIQLFLEFIELRRRVSKLEEQSKEQGDE